MIDTCMKGQIIKLTCPGFKNPISKGFWSGFKILTFDGEPQPSRIEESESISLDATNYEVHNIDESDFVINPTNQSINTSSEWSFSLSLEFPLEQQCLVKLYFPPDLSYAVSSVSGFGFLSP
jgi:hypothetical protein